MRSNVKKRIVRGTTGVVSLLSFGLGCFASNPVLAGAGAIGLAYIVWRWRGRPKSRAEVIEPESVDEPTPPPPRPAPVDPNDTDGLIAQMADQGRYTLLLRPEVAANLDERQREEAKEALFEAMTLVPDGEVVLGQIDDALDDGELDDEEIAEYRGRVVPVQHFLLDRFAVTNREYFEFVAAGGYEQVALWDEAIWPAVLDFVDQTGQPGPRFWRHGCWATDRADHPVVGISWFEAAAYARWVGKRLPSGAEWVKAGSWPVKLSDARLQRRYPWGETMDRSRANLWGSGPGHTVPVGELGEGVSVGGAYQLIGNVWEWTTSDFFGETLTQGPLTLDVPMKTIRGGAFDTYFGNQATCHFQSGEAAMARKHNIGFRCAVGVCDLMLADLPEVPAEDGELVAASAEEGQL